MQTKLGGRVRVRTQKCIQGVTFLALHPAGNPQKCHEDNYICTAVMQCL